MPARLAACSGPAPGLPHHGNAGVARKAGRLHTHDAPAKEKAPRIRGALRVVMALSIAVLLVRFSYELFCTT